MRTYLAIFVTLIFIGCAGDAGMKFENVTMDQALKKARNEKKQVLLDFYSPT